MKTLQITLILAAMVSLGVVLEGLLEHSARAAAAEILKPTNEISKDADPPSEPGNLITLGAEQDLAELVRNAPGVVLIDFYADWCGPCVKQGELLQELEPFAARNSASIIKINVDQHQNLAALFDVSALPTMLLVKDGKIVDRQTGFADQNRVVELLSR